MADRANRNVLLEGTYDDALKHVRFEVFAHAGRVPAGQYQAIERPRRGLGIGHRRQEARIGHHRVMRGPAIAVGAQQRAPGTESGAGQDARVGTCRTSVRRGKADLVTFAGECLPRHAGFGGIESLAGQRYQDEGHRLPACAEPAAESPLLPGAIAYSSRPAPIANGIATVEAEVY